MSRWLIIVGVILIVLGLLWPFINKIGLFRLPGDIVLRRNNFVFYFPLATSLILSVLLSLALWVMRR